MKNVAKDFVKDNILACCSRLDRSIAILGQGCGEEFFTRYRREVGNIMGHFFLEILRGLIDLDKDPDYGEELPPPTLAREAAIEATMAKIDEARHILETVERFIEQEQIPDVGEKWTKATRDGFDMLDALARLLESQRPG